MLKKNILSKNLLVILLLALIVFAAAFLVAFRFFLGGLNSERIYNKELILAGRVFKVEVASSTMDKIMGLSGREGLDEDSGMLFTYDSVGSYGFWMKGMKFPLDIIWIKGDAVAGFAENVEPEPGKALWNLKIYYPPEPVDKILEVSAGTVKKYEIHLGDKVSWSPN